MPGTSVTSTRGEGWAVIRLSNPDGLNKLGTDTLEPIRDLVLRLAGDPEIGCLGLVGEGGSFAVGADLREIRRLTPASARSFSDLGNSIFRALERSEALVLAGIDGFCLGGGLDLALAADWRLATPRSIFGHPGSDLGLITGFGGTQRLPRLVGQRRALSWLLSGQRIQAEDAYRYGLVQELCREEEFGDRVMNRVEGFAKQSRPHIGWVKRLMIDRPDPVSAVEAR